MALESFGPAAKPYDNLQNPLKCIYLLDSRIFIDWLQAGGRMWLLKFLENTKTCPNTVRKCFTSQGPLNKLILKRTCYLHQT